MAQEKGSGFYAFNIYDYRPREFVLLSAKLIDKFANSLFRKFCREGADLTRDNVQKLFREKGFTDRDFEASRAQVKIIDTDLFGEQIERVEIDKDGGQLIFDSFEEGCGTSAQARDLILFERGEFEKRSRRFPLADFFLSGFSKLQANLKLRLSPIKDYMPVVSGTGLRGISHADTKRIDGKYNEMKDTMLYITDDIELSILDFYGKGLVSYSTSAHMLLRILLIEFTHTKDKSFDLSLSDFMRYRGLKDEKSAREQLRRDLDVLYRLSVTFKERKYKDNPRLYNGIRILQAMPSLERGKARIVFSDMFFQYLQTVSNQIEQFPTALLQLSAKHDRYTFNVGQYLSYLGRTQAGQANQDHLKISTVLDRCDFLTEEQTNGHAKREIIRPFIDALDKLIKIGYFKRYEFTSQQGGRITDISTLSYNEFADLILDYVTTTPDQTHLIERREQQQERAKANAAKKRKASKKKAKTK